VNGQPWHFFSRHAESQQAGHSPPKEQAGNVKFPSLVGSSLDGNSEAASDGTVRSFVPLWIVEILSARGQGTCGAAKIGGQEDPKQAGFINGNLDEQVIVPGLTAAVHACCCNQ